MRFDHLAKAPFNLDAEAIAWVEQRFAALSPDDKLRQLFTLLSRGMDGADIARIRTFRPGGITRHAGADVAAERALFADLNAAAPVPLLVSADLEGSRMSLAAGAEMPNPLALAAIDDV